MSLLGSKTLPQNRWTGLRLSHSSTQQDTESQHWIQQDSSYQGHRALAQTPQQNNNYHLDTEQALLSSVDNTFLVGTLQQWLY